MKLSLLKRFLTIFVRFLSIIPDSRTYLRRWQLVIIMLILCWYFSFHQSVKDMFFLSTSAKYSVRINLPHPVTRNMLPLCGPIVVRNDKKEQSEVKRRLQGNYLREVGLGGYHHPKKCRSKHKVAILVPYRNRAKNLEIFLTHLHPFLIKQQLEYRIFIIEQTGEDPFNRGKLLNIGFKEMQKYSEWRCVVMHDVDFLPQSDKISYTCPVFPRHMVGLVVDKANLTYNQYHLLFGGVTALSVEHYKLINGFSNMYWGWGGEDNDMYWRIHYLRLPMVRYNQRVALYKSLSHNEQPRNIYRYQLLKFAIARYKMDGLSNLVYKVIWTKYRHLYTHILADVNPLKENITELYEKLFPEYLGGVNASMYESSVQLPKFSRYLDYQKLGVKTYALSEYESALQDLKTGIVARAMFKIV